MTTRSPRSLRSLGMTGELDPGFRRDDTFAGMTKEIPRSLCSLGMTKNYLFKPSLPDLEKDFSFCINFLQRVYLLFIIYKNSPLVNESSCFRFRCCATRFYYN